MSAAAAALGLMMRFAERTGLVGDRPPHRYLWTDAFAVCNFIGLGRTALAAHTAAEVHRILGHHRGDSDHTGWLSGLDDEQAARHPTIGGLRIGKPLPERALDEPVVERLEWDRDGQYFHYLTKWMHALDRLADATDDPRYHVWARELAEVAYQRFTIGPPTRRRMVWKMSVDLSYAQVRSMGHHDPLDGLVTCLALDASAPPGPIAGPELDDAITDYRAMIDPTTLATADPLGLGGLLVDAYRLAQIRARHGLATRDAPLVEALLGSAEVGLEHYAGQLELSLAADERLAFRELGLAIGLAAIARLERGVTDRFARFASIGPRIVAFWREPDHQRGHTWHDHQDIDEVMLATALAPDGFLAEHTPAAHARWAGPSQHA